MTRKSLRHAMSLVEVLVVIGIIGLLFGLLLPAVQRVRDSASKARCANNLHQIGLALHHYHDGHGSLPPGVRGDHNGKEPYPWLSWNARLLPLLEQEPLWKRTQEAFAQARWFEKVPPHTGFAMAMPTFACPADSRTLSVGSARGIPVGFTSYLGIEGINQSTHDGVLFLDSRVRFTDITDGTTNTLCVGERPPNPDGVFGWWYGGQGQSLDGSADMVLGVLERNVGTFGCDFRAYEFGPGSFGNPCDVFHFWSPHAGGGANFLVCDGSVRFLPYSTASIMPGLATRNGGEAVSLPD